MKEIYVIKQGKYYSDSYMKCACSTKKEAQKLCRMGGFKFNSEQQLFLNDERQQYRKIAVLDFNPEAI